MAHDEADQDLAYTQQLAAKLHRQIITSHKPFLRCSPVLLICRPEFFMYILPAVALAHQPPSLAHPKYVICFQQITCVISRIESVFGLQCRCL